MQVILSQVTHLSRQHGAVAYVRARARPDSAFVRAHRSVERTQKHKEAPPPSPPPSHSSSPGYCCSRSHALDFSGPGPALDSSGPALDSSEPALDYSEPALDFSEPALDSSGPSGPWFAGCRAGPGSCTLIGATQADNVRGRSGRKRMSGLGAGWKRS